MIDDIYPDARVLVCVVTRLADMAHARDHGWYRVPVKHAPRGMAAEVLAFYQTAAFGEERWAIRWVAPVQRVSLATRRELLPEESTHPRADQRYYHFRLGPLVALPLPVPARRLRRITFIPTTMGQLLRARDVTELWRAPTEGAADVWGAGVTQRPTGGSPDPLY